MTKTSPTIYTILGKMGSGKDHLTNRLIAHFEKNGQLVQSLAFANQLKFELEDLIIDYRNGLTLEQLIEKHHFKQEDLSDLTKLFKEILPKDLTNVTVFQKTHEIRTAFQFYSTIRKRWNINYFVDSLISKLTDPNIIYVVTDTRFKNEYNALLKLNVKIVKLDIPEKIRIDRIQNRDGFKPSNKQLTDQSEVIIDDLTADLIITHQDQLDKVDLEKVLEM